MASRVTGRRSWLVRERRRGPWSRGQVVGDDVDHFVVVEVRGPDLAFVVFLLLALFLGLLVGGLFLGVFGDVLGPELRLVERDRVPGLAFDVFLDLLVELLELGVGFPTVGGTFVELGDQIGGDAVVVVVGQAADLVELEGVVHLPFAEVALIVHGRDVDMRRNAIDLGALAVGPVELLDRQLQGAAVRLARASLPAGPPADMVVDHDDLLDGPLAERAGIADDQAPAIIADHAREDLRRTGAELVDQDDERAVPGGPFVVVVKMLDAEDFLDLDDRAGVDEKPGEGLGFLEQAAAVAAEIDDDRVDAARFEFVQELPAVDLSH